MSGPDSVDQSNSFKSFVEEERALFFQSLPKALGPDPALAFIEGLLSGDCRFHGHHVEYRRKFEMEAEAERQRLEKEEREAEENAMNDPSRRMRALYDYASERSGHLQFKADDIIIVSEDMGSGLLLGKFNGRMGLFPQSYVQQAEVADGSAGERTSTDEPKSDA